MPSSGAYNGAVKPAAALPVREGVAPVRDRLMTTAFLAALLHGILLLGVTFGSAGDAARDSARGLKVMIVSEEVPPAERNDSAAYLAQRTQLGSGTGDAGRTPRNRARLAEAAEAAPRPNEPAEFERMLATTAPRSSISYLGTVAAEPAPRSRRFATANANEAVAGDDVEDTALEGDERKDLWVTPDTRESIIAPYLDGWRRKIERLGTLNYPAAARAASGVGNPVLEVAIDSSGTLETAVIRESSGSAELDDAAIQILKLASPFEPFPQDLAAQYRVLRFAYAWEFAGGRAAEGTVTAPADSR